MLFLKFAAKFNYEKNEAIQKKILFVLLRNFFAVEIFTNSLVRGRRRRHVRPLRAL